MSKTFTCPHCGQIALHHAHHSCRRCYDRQRIQYFQEYRQRIEYKEQRLKYDITYVLHHLSTPNLPTK